MMRTLLAVLVLLLSCVGRAGAFDGGEVECGSLRNAVGPYDYRKEKTHWLTNVESNHFNANVRALVKGQSATIAADLDYLLRAFPNHHAGLDAMARYGRKLKSERPGGSHYKVRCYFDRAIRLAPDDWTVRFIYSQHLWLTGQRQDGLEQIEKAVELGADNANTFYNAGLMMLEMGRKEDAVKYAKRAYGMGFPLPGLRDKLKAENLWTEP
jgi:tetratricopeptide (TPR) repeat protein